MHAGGDLDAQFSFFGYLSFAAAFLTRIGDHLSGSLALWARRDHLEKSAQSGSLDLTVPATGAALAGLFSLGYTGSGAFAAGVLPCELDGFFGSGSDFFQC
jgi:hypothetical protein